MIAEACIGRRLSRRRPSSGGGPPVFSYFSSPGQERDSFPQSMPRGREVLDLLAAAVSNLSIATRSGRYWALRAAGLLRAGSAPVPGIDRPQHLTKTLSAQDAHVMGSPEMRVSRGPVCR